LAHKNKRPSGSVVTINDAARHADISPMTVSRAINSGTNVSEETRDKANASIKALRFSPNLAAADWAGGRKRLLADRLVHRLFGGHLNPAWTFPPGRAFMTEICLSRLNLTS